MLSSPPLTVTKLRSSKKNLPNSGSFSNPSSPSRGMSTSAVATPATLPPPPPTTASTSGMIGDSPYQPKLANALTFNPRETHRPQPPLTAGSTRKYMDKTISKMCFKIRGAVSSANYVTNGAKVKDLRPSWEDS